MKKRVKISLLFIILVGLVSLIAGCASSGGGRPGWVDNPPGETGESFSFVAAGSDPGGDEAAARQQAGSQLVSEITRYLGVRITSDTTVEARDAYGEFESQVSQTITESSRAQIGDLQVVDSYTSRGPSGVTVYLLAEYDRGALLNEKARLEALFAEQEEAISGPEGEGNALFAAGEYYRAALKYAEAALAAASSGVDNADIRFERNINSAKRALAEIRLVPQNDLITGTLNTPFTDPFRLKVTGGADETVPGLSGVDIRISYQVMRRGRLSPTSETVRTDGQGVVVFRRPPAAFVGKENLTMSLDFRSVLEPLMNLRDPYYDLVGGLEQVVNQKRVVFPYEVISLAREIPTAVVLLDRDRGGNPMGRSDSASGIFEILTEKGFKVFQVDPAAYAGLSEGDLLDRLKADLGGRYERVIFGYARIVSFEEADGAVIVQVAGEARGAELSTGTILYSASTSSRARGSSQTGTISAAFKTLGKNLGEAMVNNLP